MIEREVSSVESIREDRILAKVTGAELAYGVVLDSTNCSATVDTAPMTGHQRTNKIYYAGTLLVKNGATGRFSYYVKDDGTWGTVDDLCVLKRDVNVTLGNRPAGAWKAFCCFDERQILYGTTKTPLNAAAGAVQTAVKTALQNCEFIVPTEITS